ncbi:MAG: hybrid sensor histidine kinase/response regulator, partial [Succinivibrio sp.]
MPEIKKPAPGQAPAARPAGRVPAGSASRVQKGVPPGARGSAQGAAGGAARPARGAGSAQGSAARSNGAGAPSRGAQQSPAAAAAKLQAKARQGAAKSGASQARQRQGAQDQGAKAGDQKKPSSKASDYEENGQGFGGSMNFSDDVSEFPNEEEELLRAATSKMFTSAGRKRSLFFVLGLALISALLAFSAVFCLNKFQKLTDQFFCDTAASKATRMAALTRERLDSEFRLLMGAAASLDDGNGDPEVAARSVSSDEGTYAGVISYDGSTVAGKVLDSLSFNELTKVFHGNPEVGFYPDVGLIFVYPVFYGSNVRYALYKVIKPLFLDRFTVDGPSGDGKVVIRNPSGIVVRPRYYDQRVINFYNSPLARTVMVALKDLRENRISAATTFRNSDGRNYIMYEAEVPNTNLVVTGIIEKDSVEGGFKGMKLIIALLSGLFGVLVVAGAVLLFLSLEQLWSAAAARQRDGLEKLIFGARERALSFMSKEVSAQMGAILDLDYKILDTARDSSVLNFAGAIRQAGMTLLSLIGSIVDFARIQTGKMEIVGEQYDLATMINDLVKEANERAASKDVKFVINVNNQLPSRLYGDMVRIRQVVTNLIDNAFKFTPRGQVGLTVTGALSDDNTSVMLRFKVSDTGPGLSDEERERFFSQFSNPSSAKAIKHRHGLGLAICYNLLKLMRGFIDIQSLPGKGSVFTAAVPQQVVSLDPIGNFLDKARSEARRRAESFSSFTAPDARALVVDDNSMSLKLISKLLQRPAVKADMSSSGDEALKLMCIHHYDIILLDEKMPGMDAREVLARSRGMDGNKNEDTPVILISSDKTPGARSRAIQEGFTDMIQRPIEQMSMDSVLRRYLPKEKLTADTSQQGKYEAPSPASDRSESLQHFKEIDP